MTYEWHDAEKDKPDPFQIVIIWPQLRRAEYIDGFFTDPGANIAFLNVKAWIPRKALPAPPHSMI